VGTKCSYIWCFKNEEIERFVVKYLKVDKKMLSNKICNMQTHPFKEHVEKNVNQFANFSIQNHQRKYKNIVASR
jgi:hypothetical protein